jgi:hypothetical protein
VWIENRAAGDPWLTLKLFMSSVVLVHIANFSMYVLFLFYEDVAHVDFWYSGPLEIFNFSGACLV